MWRSLPTQSLCSGFSWCSSTGRRPWGIVEWLIRLPLSLPVRFHSFIYLFMTCLPGVYCGSFCVSVFVCFCTTYACIHMPMHGFENVMFLEMCAFVPEREREWGRETGGECKRGREQTQPSLPVRVLAVVVMAPHLFPPPPSSITSNRAVTLMALSWSWKFSLNDSYVWTLQITLLSMKYNLISGDEVQMEWMLV